MFDLEALLQAAGYGGIFAIVFVESGVIFGFFFPGDSLIFTAGFLASQGVFNVWWLGLLIFFASVLGAQVGYVFGKRVGPMLFSRQDSMFFHKRHIIRAQEFYAKHGKKAIVLARFMPIVRTFAPILAGVGVMHYRTFVLYNAIGGAIWSFGFVLAGYFLGAVVPNPDRYVLPVVLVVVLASLAPFLIRAGKNYRLRRKS